MLNHKALVAQLESVSKDLCVQFTYQKDIALGAWNAIRDDITLPDMIKSRKWPFLVPYWKGIIGCIVKIEMKSNSYVVLAVDGSQVYYDKHQGPACYLINIGSVLLTYGQSASSVQMQSIPYVMVAQNSALLGQEFVNGQREEFELKAAVELSIKYQQDNEELPFLCLLDGTLIFSSVDDATNTDSEETFFQKYIEQLEKLFKNNILHAGYISFPRGKELVNILKITLSGYDGKQDEASSVLDGLCDMDIAHYFLPLAHRSIIFESKAPTSYLYPKHLRPYFCFLNVGKEIVRLELPQWIARDESIVNQICQMVIDQAGKGRGYPVCLFEAHEQAVIKAMDREFFYLMIQKMIQKYNGFYAASQKSMKKMQAPI